VKAPRAWNDPARTTIEMRPEHRAKLIEIAASRGDKGFSGAVAEAIDAWIESRSARRNALTRALKLKGVLAAGDVSVLGAKTRQIRVDWS